ncbi:hypothetical protein NECID01_2126, partial [Nematocida sp. AWRm77]
NSIDMGYIRCLLLSSVSETEIRRLHNYIVFPFLQELEVCDCTIEKVSSIFAQDSKYRRVRVLSLRRVRLLFKIDLGFPNWMENLKLLTLEKIGFVEDQDYGTAKMERYLETFKVDVFLWSKYTFPEFDSAEYVKDKQASSRAIKITGIQYVDSRQREQEKEITFAINSITHTLMVFSHWNNCTQDLVPVLKNIKLPFCSSRYANIKRLEWLSHNIGTDGVLESRYLKILVSAYGKDLDSFVFMDAKTNLLKSKELKTEITVESMLQYTSSECQKTAPFLKLFAFVNVSISGNRISLLKIKQETYGSFKKEYPNSLLRTLIFMYGGGLKKNQWCVKEKQGHSNYDYVQSEIPAPENRPFNFGLVMG